MNDPKIEIAELVVKVQQGDKNAFGELYKLISPRSLFVALEITKNKQDAEDILQDSFITAYEKIYTLEKPESFVSWFNQIVANKSRDFLKKKKPMLFDEEEKQVFELIPDDDREFSPQENFNDKETRQLVLDAVNELSDEKRICVLLHYYNEMSIADIAQAVGSNENTVKSRLFQARKDLSTKFKELERKGLYSFSPIGLVLWAWQGAESSVTEGFIGSETASTILASVTAKAGAGTAAAGATTGTAATATATATAGVSAATVSSAATGAGGIAAKIAAMTVVQKIAAGVVIAGVVTGSAAGTAAIIKNSNTSEETTGVYTTVGDKKMYSSAFIESVVSDTDLSVSDVTEEALSAVVAVSEDSSEKETEPVCTVPEKVAATVKANATEAVSNGKKTTTRRERTTRERKRTTAAPTEESTTAPATKTDKTTTEKETTTKKEKTTRPTTAKATAKATTTKKVTTTKPTTTKPTTTTTKPTTTEPTTLADPIVRIQYVPADSQDWVDYPEFSVPPGTELDVDYIYDFMMNKSGIEMVDAQIDSADYTSSAESGETYYFKIYCF